MNKKYIISKNLEFQELIKKGKKEKTRFFVIHYKNNNYNYNRYGISVGKKIGKAVTRNKIKRQIKSILSKNKLNYSKDYVIIVRKEILSIKYFEIKKVLNNILKEKIK